jgi:putative flippase GtrA
MSSGVVCNCSKQTEPLLLQVSSNSQYVEYQAKRGRHRKRIGLQEMASEHGRRLVSFSLIGFAVFALGLGAQVLLVQTIHLSPVPAYVIQLVVSVQANFLANYHWTWGDRDAPFWRSCWRYNVKRASGALLSLALYPLLIQLGMNYLVANVMIVIGLTPTNYVLGHFWTFAAGSGPTHAAGRRGAPQVASGSDGNEALAYDGS